MRNEEVNKIFENALDQDRDFLFEHEAKRLCSLYGMPVTKLHLTSSPEEAIKAVEDIGYPIVLKIVSPQVLHKSDAGGVILDIDNPEEVRKGYDKIIQNIKENVPDAEITGILVQEMAPESTEIIVGGTIDPTFGTTLMFGLGGVFVEVLEDVSFRLSPINRVEAEEMIREIKAYKILEGFRGQPDVDKEAIIDILLSTSKMMEECPEINELDLNPILVYEDGAKIVDARIILK
jgi:acetyl-CoA synthetase (ADP-forming)